MGETTYAGLDGYIMASAADASSNVVGEMSHWSLTIDAPSIDTTVFQSSGWGSSMTSVRTWSGTCDGFFDCGDSGQTSLWTAITTSAKMDLYMHIADDKYYYGEAYATSWNADITVAGVATASFNYQGTGTLNKTCE